MPFQCPVGKQTHWDNVTIRFSTLLSISASPTPPVSVVLLISPLPPEIVLLKSAPFPISVPPPERCLLRPHILGPDNRRVHMNAGSTRLSFK